VGRVQRFHHDARIDFQDFPGPVDADDIDRAEPHFDRSRGLYRNRNAGAGPGVTLFENGGLRADQSISSEQMGRKMRQLVGILMKDPAVQTVVDAFPGLLVFVVPGLIIVAFLPAPGLIR